jgi:diaminopimelate decarboxylase
MRAHPAGPLHGDGLAQAMVPPVPDQISMSRLDAAIWPATARRDASGAMVIGGCSVRDLAVTHGTPLMLLDEADFRARAAAFQSAYTDPTIPGTVSFAGKAFLSGTTVRWLAEEGLGLDVCTGGELALATAAGFPGERLTLHGNNKSDDELRAGLAAGVGRFVIDSLEEVTRLADLAGQAGVVADALIRVTTGVEAHTHEFIATAHEDQKFGLSLTSGVARQAVLAARARPELRLVGIHSHIGSQIFSTSGFEVAAHRVVGFIADLAEQDGVTVEELNLGGGMGIAYLPSDDPVAPVGMAEALRIIVAGECGRRGIPVPRIAVEPGRAIVGPSMVTVYEVGTVKPVEHGRLADLCVRRRGDERQHPHRPVRLGVHRRPGLAAVTGPGDALARGGQALRVRRRRRARRVAAGRPRAGGPHRRRRDRRVLPGDGVELQHGPSPTGDLGPRRRRADRAAS